MIDYSLAFIVILIVIIIVYYAYCHNKLEDKESTDIISGYWVGDKNFCKDSMIENMLLCMKKKKNTIGIVQGASGADEIYNAYLIITDLKSPQTDSVGNIIDEIVEIRFKPYSQTSKTSQNDKNTRVYKYKANIGFKKKEDIPNEVIFEFQPLDGILRIYKDKKMYGILYKDNEVSYKMKSE